MILLLESVDLLVADAADLVAVLPLAVRVTVVLLLDGAEGAEGNRAKVE